MTQKSLFALFAVLVVLVFAWPAGRASGAPEAGDANLLSGQLLTGDETVPVGQPLTVTFALANTADITAAVRLTGTLGGLEYVSGTLSYDWPVSGTATVTLAALAPEPGVFTVTLDLEDQAGVYPTMVRTVRAVPASTGWQLSTTVAGGLSWPAGVTQTQVVVTGAYSGVLPSGKVLIHCPTPEQSTILSVSQPASSLCSALASEDVGVNVSPVCGPEEEVQAAVWVGADVAPAGVVSFTYSIASEAVQDVPASCYLYDLAVGRKISSTAVISVTPWSTRLPLALRNWSAPEVSFVASVRSGPPPLTVVFTDTSISRFAILERMWDLGDGATSTEANPTHVYEALGAYTVTLTVTDTAGSARRVEAGYVEVSLEPVWVTGTYEGFYYLHQNGQGITVTNAGLGAFLMEWYPYDGRAGDNMPDVVNPCGNTWDNRPVAIFSLPGAPRGDVLEGWIEYARIYTSLENPDMVPPEAVPAAYRQTNWTSASPSASMAEIKQLWYDVSPAMWEQSYGRPMGNCVPARVVIPVGKLVVNDSKIGIMFYSGAVTRPELWVPQVPYWPYPEYKHTHGWGPGCPQVTKPVIHLLIQPQS